MPIINSNTISKLEARQFLINYQGLNSKTENILDYFDKVGCIQYDPLNVVGRNADLVLQARIKGYKSEILENLLYKDRVLIDGWDKMMSIYRVSDWAHFKRIRENKISSMKNMLVRRNSEIALDFLEVIKQYISENGKISSHKINFGSTEPGSWGHRKISSASLDYLYNIGEIGISSKNNTQKIYDLIENLIPNELLNQAEPFTSDEDFYKWYVQRRIGSIGLIWERSGGVWLGYGISKKNIRTKVIKDLLDKDELEKIFIEEIKYPFYVRKKDIKYLDYKENEKEVRFLAPLDNLLWDRVLIKELFDFQYTWEVYTPIDKRKYGYYVLPVLYGDKLIARFEPEIFRGEKELRIKEWWWEENIVITEEMIFRIKKAFSEFCEYLGAEYILEKDFQKLFI